MRGTAEKKLAYPIVVAAAMLSALTYYIFILPNNFAPAGVNGIATMVQYVCGFSISYMSLLINLPMALFAFFKISRDYTCKTTLFVLVFSGTLLLFQHKIIDIERFIYFTDDYRSLLLGPVAGGAVNGVLYGWAVRCGGSSGGTDYIATYVHQEHPEVTFSKALFVFNTAVACASFFVYGCNVEPVILSVIYSSLVTNISGGIIRGGESAVKVELITDTPEELTQTLIKRLHHSATVVKAMGGYSGQPKTMLICVINPHQMKQLLEIIDGFPGTFACVSDATSIIGNFKHISPKR